jgi:hypothetical protein
MKAMIYIIRFEENLGLGDIDFYLKEIESPIRLEVGDKIALSFASFDRSLEDDKDYIGRMVELLLEKSIYPSKYRASFEISDIIYNHDYYDDDEVNFNGVITLKGK